MKRLPGGFPDFFGRATQSLDSERVFNRVFPAGPFFWHTDPAYIGATFAVDPIEYPYTEILPAFQGTTLDVPGHGAHGFVCRGWVALHVASDSAKTPALYRRCFAPFSGFICSRDYFFQVSVRQQSLLSGETDGWRSHAIQAERLIRGPRRNRVSWMTFRFCFHLRRSFRRGPRLDVSIQKGCLQEALP